MRNAEDSAYKIYKFLPVRFHVYEMNTPIGKSQELLDHIKESSNEKAIINMKL